MLTDSTRRSRGRWVGLGLVLLLPVLAWWVARPRGARPGGVSAPRPLARGHRPVSSPHAREIAQLNRRVIADYEGRHHADGEPSA